LTEQADKPDWERIEVEYRAGVLSLREIAELHPGVNHVAISRRSKREGWTQDLSAKIQAKAERLVTERVVTPDVTELRSVTEREVIDANAQRIADVRTRHRTDISRACTLAMAMLGELEAETGELERMIRLGEQMFEPDEKTGRDRRNEIYTKVISSAGRIDNMKKLSETLKNLISMEREAYGIKDSEKPDSGLRAVPVTDADMRL
jgi:hypothetical protein